MPEKPEGTTEQQLGQFGFKTSADVTSFLLTITGEKVQNEIAQAVFKQIKQIQSVREFLNTQEKQEGILLAFKKAEEDEKDVQRKIDIAAEQSKLEKAIQKPQPPTEDNKDSSGSFPTAERVYKTKDKHADKIIIDTKKKYKDEKRELSKIGRNIDKINKMPDKQEREAFFNQIISSLQKEQDDLLKEKRTLPKTAASAKVLQGRADAKALQIQQYQRMQNVSSDKTYMCAHNGQSVDKFNQAAFFVPKGQQIVREKGKYYLFDQGKKLDQLSDVEKAKALKEFKEKERELRDIRMIREHDRKKEMGPLYRERNAIQAQMKKDARTAKSLENPDEDFEGMSLIFGEDDTPSSKLTQESPAVDTTELSAENPILLGAPKNTSTTERCLHTIQSLTPTSMQTKSTVAPPPSSKQEDQISEENDKPNSSNLP